MRLSGLGKDESYLEDANLLKKFINKISSELKSKNKLKKFYHSYMIKIKILKYSL